MLLPRCFRSRPTITVGPDKYARDAEAWTRHGVIVYQAARSLFDAVFPGRYLGPYVN